MNETQLDPVLLEQIDNLTREEACRLWRFAPSGHPFFDINSPYCEIFFKKFKELGGFSPEISKKIGWKS